MSYTDVFGGETIFPSLTSYLSITTAVDLTLQWPREQQIAGFNVVADWMDIDTSAPALNIDMPSASFTSTGNKAIFSNIGANTFTVRDSTGGTIQSVAPGEQWILILTDNTTTAGTWTTSQLGATVSVASASALAGAGIKAITTTLNQQIDSDVEAATPFTVVDGDRAKCLIYTAGAGTANLPSPGAVANDWFFMLRNSGSGTLNVLPPSGLIDGGASINLDPEDSAFIFTDGTDFFTVGLSTGSTIAFDFVSIAIPGSGDFVLSGANLDRISYRFTGVLTGNRRIVVPNTTQQYWVDNQTTGAFTLEIDTAAGAGQVVPQGESVILYCDATDVINASSSTSVSFPITIGQGGTGATTVGGAQANLQVPPTSRDMIAGAGMTGGGTLAADRTFDVVAGVGLLVNADDVDVIQATEGLLGGAELATQVETDAGVDDTRIVTPLKLAAFVPASLIGVSVYDQITADVTVNNSTALVDVLTTGTNVLLANAVYIVEGYLYMRSSLVAGGRFTLDALGEADMSFMYTMFASGGGSDLREQDNGSGAAQTQFITMSGATNGHVMFKMQIQMAGGPGTFRVQWAQSVAEVSNSEMKAGSWIRWVQTS